MSLMVSQITRLTIVYSTVYSGVDQKKTSKLRVTGLCAGNSPGTGEFSAQMASNAENVSIWWRHHADEVSRAIAKKGKNSMDQINKTNINDIKISYVKVNVELITSFSRNCIYVAYDIFVRQNMV